MKCFIAIEEDLLMEIWLLDPNLVAPFSRPVLKKRTRDDCIAAKRQGLAKGVATQSAPTPSIHSNPKLAEGG